MTVTERLFANSPSRMRASRFVFANMAAAAVLFAFSAYFVGKYREEYLDFNRPPTVTEADAVIPIEYALTSHEKNDVIFLGDSTSQSGIDPVYFESLTGLTAYNLSSFGPLSIDGFCVTARAYLLNHPAPRVLMLSLCPCEPSLEFANSERAERFVRVYRRRTGLVDSDEGYIEPMLRGAGLIRDHTSALLQWTGVRDMKLDGSPRETVKTREQKRHKNRGCNPLPVRTPQANPPAFEKGRLSLAPEWDRGVRSLIALTEARGVRFMIRLAPIRADAACVNFEEIESWLHSIAKSHPNVIVYSEIVFYEPAFCWDATHTNTRGLEKFTRLVADDVRSALRPMKGSTAQQTSSKD